MAIFAVRQDLFVGLCPYCYYAAQIAGQLPDLAH